MTILKNTEDCKKLLEVGGITGWKRTSKCKYLGYEVRNFESGNNLAVIVTNDTNELLAHSIVSPEPVYSDWAKAIENYNDLEIEPDYGEPFITVSPNNFIFLVDGGMFGEENEISISLTPIEYWKNKNCMFDQHVEVPETGIFPEYISTIDDMECIWSSIEEVTQEQTFIDMINLGFYWEKKYQDFVSRGYDD